MASRNWITDLKKYVNKAEYLRLLETAQKLDKERVYLLIKLFGAVEPSVRVLPELTVETIKCGKMILDRYGSKHIVRLPEILQKALLVFANIGRALVRPALRDKGWTGRESRLC